MFNQKEELIDMLQDLELITDSADCKDHERLVRFINTWVKMKLALIDYQHVA